jgi:hypothetical protein
MMMQMRNGGVIVLAGCLVLALAASALAKDQFEKTNWKIKVSPTEESQKQGKEFDDTVSFKGSKMESKALKAKGFKAAAYEEDTRSGIISTFKSTMSSDKEGKAEWSGTLTGSEIKGELKWTKADGTVVNYTYEGSKSD